ncbi:hypothetical protein MNAB215_5038 [Mycobacterium numidiamassiliense]|uniref:Secreted protein n=1 Tax=Mycobacterium numidiamassiliense TaxID=1841861 RepID=A0A2U3PGD3_9MYCO|nr:hypothetical protein [Mycobacterium numidiamassiliense]SPM42818.1 hypothetical protein MNAB215_5038 [Mycobacterium numidiamassiliense]
MIALRVVPSAVVAVGVIAAPSAHADNQFCSSDQVCSFYSPSHAISCEIDYQRGGIPDSTYCQINTPQLAQSAHMDATGTYTICNGQSCMGNPGLGQATLPYGESVGLGPFGCRSEVNGLTCTVSSGSGFAISSSGIVKVP